MVSVGVGGGESGNGGRVTVGANVPKDEEVDVGLRFVLAGRGGRLG